MTLMENITSLQTSENLKEKHPKVAEIKQSTITNTHETNREGHLLKHSSK